MSQTNSPGNTRFGDRLRQARIRAGLSQEQLAHLAGMSVWWLGRIEAGAKEPHLSHLLALFDALGRRECLTWLVTGVAVATSPKEEELKRREFMLSVAAAALPATLSSPMILDLERLASPSLEPSVLTELEALTAQFARLRPVLAPREWLPMAEAHLAGLRSRLDVRSSGPLQRRLLSIIAGTSALCGWTCLMAERRQDARSFLDYGERLAREAQDQDTVVLLLLLRADLLSAVPTGGLQGFPDQARTQLDQAMTLTSPTTAASLRAHVTLRAAEEHAYVGDEMQALRLLDTGCAVAARHRPGEAGHPLRPIVADNLTTFADRFRGSALRLLGKNGEAVDLLQAIAASELPRVPAGQPMLLADMGAAYAQAGDMDGSLEALARATDVAVRYGYFGAARRIAGVRRRQLERWADEPAVRQLDERLAAIL
jgi:transcriptional regulator with XRE-family HTH domain